MDGLERLSLIGLLPMVKILDARDALSLCEALISGEVPAVEIAWGNDAAQEAVARVHDAMPDVLLAAGGIETAEQADRAMAAGASLISAAGLTPALMKHCLRKGYPVLPGCAGPSDIETALSLGLTTVKLFLDEAAGGAGRVKALAETYGNVRFVIAGEIRCPVLPAIFACPQVSACASPWIAPQAALDAKDWDTVQTQAQAFVRDMLGLYVAHVGINNADEETTWREGRKLSALLGTPIIRDNPNSLFVSTEIEMMKTWYRGAHGHLAVATLDVPRARWHMERRGFTFDDATVRYAPDGRLKFIYVQEEIAGFAIHLLLDEKING